jgi:CheY-like chemotaxis protein
MAKILYLEDEGWQVQNTVITFMEKELGHTVKLVSSIEETTNELSTIAYDVVFLDIMLDLKKGLIEFENSGLQIIQLILADQFATAGNPSTLPIIIASGVWDATIKDSVGTGWTVEDRVRALGISYKCFLRKPFLVDEVQEVLARALNRDEEG